MSERGKMKNLSLILMLILLAVSFINCNKKLPFYERFYPDFGGKEEQNDTWEFSWRCGSVRDKSGAGQYNS